MMLSIQYTVGQLNSPIEQFVQLIYGQQDVKISQERMKDIKERTGEDTKNTIFVFQLKNFFYTGIIPMIENVADRL